MERKTFKTFGLFATAALITAFSACQNKDTKTTETKKTDSTTAAVSVNEKIVFVNQDSLLTKYEYYKDLKNKFEKKTKDAQSDLQSKQQAYQREVTQYQQSAGTLSADQRKTTEERLGRKGQELQAYQQNAGGALQNEQAVETEKLYDKVAGYLKTYSKEKGYKMVLTYSKGNSAILFADESLDITSDVIKGLNAEYTKK
ncbi:MULTISPECIES: OmpH family outer membrane protein [unclassified Pedobacter]|jgi:outer membrane protein|uniref:OmpH family outer membrane protein n=1 Tax=unclassified Pedobacter TaxID=2628915 RepID=UPI000B4B7976|nr:MULTISPECIES: OmpH family outer membrane protein [unclassified Pedobacter]MCX2431160.1 OmpH family outer membrane protein [Pedobacter sp. GR22-10]MCX2584584.1 OmpH family outer membrane protein [Pedobacter sp. MR22-3]OWK69108.1 outer membrane chaperone Skp [Pedobacter sp. AJM]